MLNRVIEWSMRNVFLVLLGTLFVIGAGVYAIHKTPLDAIPIPAGNVRYRIVKPGLNTAEGSSPVLGRPPDTTCTTSGAAG